MKQIDKLREHKIYNDCNISNLGDKIFVSYSRNGGRSCLRSWWAVPHATKRFKDSAWYEYGAKTFTCDKKSDIEPFMKALKFASKITGHYEWVKTVFGGYVSKFTSDKIGLKYKENNIIKIEKEGT